MEQGSGGLKALIGSCHPFTRAGDDDRQGISSVPPGSVHDLLNDGGNIAGALVRTGSSRSSPGHRRPGYTR